MVRSNGGDSGVRDHGLLLRLLDLQPGQKDEVGPCDATSRLDERRPSDVRPAGDARFPGSLGPSVGWMTKSKTCGGLKRARRRLCIKKSMRSFPLRQIRGPTDIKMGRGTGRLMPWLWMPQATIIRPQLIGLWPVIKIAMAPLTRVGAVGTAPRSPMLFLQSMTPWVCF